MINPRISADWSTTKPIAAFSCTPRVQELFRFDFVAKLHKVQLRISRPYLQMVHE